MLISNKYNIAHWEITAGDYVSGTDNYAMRHEFARKKENTEIKSLFAVLAMLAAGVFFLILNLIAGIIL